MMMMMMIIIIISDLVFLFDDKCIFLTVGVGKEKELKE